MSSARIRIEPDDPQHRHAAALGYDQLAAIVQASTDAIFTKTLEGVITSWNAGAERLYGYTATEAVGQNVSIVLPPGTEGELQDIMRRLWRGERIERYRTQRRRKDGKVLTVSVSISPLHSAKGDVVGAASIAHDVTAEVETVSKLREHERSLQMALQAASAVAWQWDTKTNTLEANGEIEPLRGLDYMRDPYGSWQYIHPDDRAKAEAAIKQALTAGGSYELEYRFVHPSGKTYWLLTRAQVEMDAHRQPLRIVGITTDVTQRKRMERALRESESAFRELANTIPQIAWTAHPDGSVDYFNQRWFDYTGLTLAETSDMGWQGVLHPEDRQTLTAAWQNSVATGGVFGIESRIRAADGTYRWHVIRAITLRNDQGHVAKWIGTCTDIHDLKVTQQRLQHSETALRKSEAQLRTVLDSLPVGVVFADVSGQIVFANPATHRIWGGARYVGLSDYGVYKGWWHPEGNPVKPEDWPLARALRRGETTLNEVIEIESFDGGRKIIRNSAMPLEDNGAIVGGVVLLEDVTDRLRSEQALIRAEKLASAGRLAATIAHEINNPLEAVTNILYLLAQNRSLPDETRDYARLAEQELTRVAHIAKQTLGFYRETAAPAVVDVAAQLDELLMIYWKRMAEKKIDLVRDYEPGTDITCYPGELRQVVSNLISNAIDATTGGSIKVRARRSVSPNTKRKGVRITVADTGTGISSKRLPHVFEPFYTTKKDVGTGLGLWVCQNIITKHGGSIRVRSSVVTESHGTVFSVFLPGLASARNQQAARAAGVPRHGSQRDEE